MISATCKGGGSFGVPVSKVVCVGRNYAAHARELNNPIPDTPLLFIKPNSSVVPLSGELLLPRGKGSVHYETELAVLIGQPLSDATENDVKTAIAGLGLALDLTLRDLQSELKSQGHPWEKAKAFDGSCPLSEFIPFKDQNLDAQSFQLVINGELRQQGNTSQMLIPVLPLLVEVSRHFTLCPGDVVLTGTPEGVGELQVGDVLELQGPGELTTRCVVG